MIDVSQTPPQGDFELITTQPPVAPSLPSTGSGSTFGNVWNWLKGEAASVESEAIALKNKLPAFSQVLTPALNIARAMGTKIPLSEDTSQIQTKIDDLKRQSLILKSTLVQQAKAIKAMSDGGANFMGQAQSAFSNADTAVAGLNDALSKAQNIQTNAAKFQVTTNDSVDYLGSKNQSLQLANVALGQLRDLIVQANRMANPGQSIIARAANAIPYSGDRVIQGASNAISDLENAASGAASKVGASAGLLATAAPWLLAGGAALIGWSFLRPWLASNAAFAGAVRPRARRNSRRRRS